MPKFYPIRKSTKGRLASLRVLFCSDSPSTCARSRTAFDCSGVQIDLDYGAHRIANAANVAARVIGIAGVHGTAAHTEQVENRIGTVKADAARSEPVRSVRG